MMYKNGFLALTLVSFGLSVGAAPIDPNTAAPVYARSEDGQSWYMVPDKRAEQIADYFITPKKRAAEKEDWYMVPDKRAEKIADYFITPKKRDAEAEAEEWYMSPDKREEQIADYFISP